MTVHVYRVTRVMTGASSVARIDAADAGGHELRLEVERSLAAEAQPGRLLVLQWSLHDVPAVAVEAAATSMTTATTATTTTVRTDPAAVDQEFMELMARGRRTVAPSPAAQGRSIDSELSNLLGPAGAKGQK